MEANQQEHLPIHVAENQPKEVLTEDLFSYEDTEIQIALVNDHSCYVNVQQCCLALGLNPRGQLQRVRRPPELDEHLAQLPIHLHFVAASVALGLNMSLRKVTRNHRIFPTEGAVYKVTYLAIQNIAKK